MYKYLYLFLLISMSVSADNEGEPRQESADISAELSIISRTHELEFLDSTLEHRIHWQPSIPYVFQVALSYKSHTLRLSTDNVSDVGLDEERGNSKYSDIEYTFRHKNAEYRGYYGKYKSFYVSDQRDIAGDYFVFEDLKTKRYGFEYKAYREAPKMISINNRFSRDYGELPKTFGTIEYGLLFDVSSVNNVPSDPAVLAQINNSNYLFFNDIELITLSPFFGGLVRMSHEGYFVEAGLSMGYGIQSQEYVLDGVKENETDYSFVGSGFITLGKVFSDNGVLGLSYVIESVEPSVEENEFAIGTIDASIFYRRNF